MTGAAVVEDDRGLGEQHADEEVPHHPAGGRKPEDTVALLRVEVQAELLELLYEDPAVALDDRLRQAGGARGVEHPERVVEGQLLELDLARLARVEQLPVADRVAQAGEVGLGLQVGQDDRVLDRLHLGEQPGDDVGAVEVASVVAVAVDAEEHLGLDLREAVDHAAGAEVGRAARPDGADRGGGEEGDQGLGQVRHVGGDAVAGTDPERAQCRGRPRDLVAQLAPGQRVDLAQLRRVPDRDPVRRLVGEQVLGVVEPRAREPLGAGHLAIAEDALVRCRRTDAEELPDRGPEVLELVHRPAPQGPVVAVELESALGLEPAHVAGHVRALDGLRRGLPELDRALAHRRRSPTLTPSPPRSTPGRRCAPGVAVERPDQRQGEVVGALERVLSRSPSACRSAGGDSGA